MSGQARRKGVVGEREVAALLEAHGWTVRGLEGQGDHLATKLTVSEGAEGSWTLHVECKRQERLQLWQWIEQANREAPPGTVPVVVFRRSRGEWRADLRLTDLLRLIG